jgi:(hydroxyamino)benzene mutase
MRHPADPDIVLDSKAAAAFWLAVLGFVAGPFVGGAIPATIALVVAREAVVDLEAGAGWRYGARLVRWTRRLAWAAIGLALIAVMLILAVHLLQEADLTNRDYPANVD